MNRNTGEISTDLLLLRVLGALGVQAKIPFPERGPKALDTENAQQG